MSGPYRTPAPNVGAPATQLAPSATCEDGNKKRAESVQKVLDMLEFKGFAYPIVLRAVADSRRGVLQIHLSLGSDISRSFWLDEVEFLRNDKTHILETLLYRIRRLLHSMVCEKLDRSATLRGGSIWSGA